MFGKIRWNDCNGDMRKLISIYSFRSIMKWESNLLFTFSCIMWGKWRYGIQEFLTLSNKELNVGSLKQPSSGKCKSYNSLNMWTREIQTFSSCTHLGFDWLEYTLYDCQYKSRAKFKKFHFLIQQVCILAISQVMH